MPPKKSKAAPKKKAEPKKPIVADPKTGECPICFENFDNDYAELKCKHYYCYNCINNWSEKENTCPVCKGRFSYLHRIQKNSETNEHTKTKLTIKKKSQADAIRQQYRTANIPGNISPYQLFSILSYSTLNMLQYHNHQAYDEDEDDDYLPNPDHSHDMDEDEDDDDFGWIRHTTSRSNIINHDDEEDDDVNIFSHFHSLLEDLMPERRGTSENPISLIEEDSNATVDNSLGNSGYRSSNSSSNAQPIVIDLTDDQVQSDIRDISNQEAPLELPTPSFSSSSSSSTNLPEQQEIPREIGIKRRRRFVPENEVVAEEAESGYTARRTRSNRNRRGEVSDAPIIDEIEL